ncbi:hypothetical protein OIU77_004238 [Salix suchowensis]|uniref:Secreted protein n=1 Tax=Salix suchowensis TaxID=1278906 RepID=A0ABQ9ATQ3_9ROSI|nr:hypothetical protein OIU77_004238 [Salix suchowensis]
MIFSPYYFLSVIFFPYCILVICFEFFQIAWCDTLHQAGSPWMHEMERVTAFIPIYQIYHLIKQRFDIFSGNEVFH